MIVMKFGGSSVESRAAIERVAEIVRARLGRKPVVVVSAMGKTTNRLLEIAEQAVSGYRVEALRLLGSLEQFHRAESPVDADEIITEHFHELAALVDPSVRQTLEAAGVRLAGYQALSLA